LRVVLDDFKRKISNKKVLRLLNRASPLEYTNFKLARVLISIVNNTDPFFLFHELLSQAVTERRAPLRPWFLDMSRKRIGRQALANRVTDISRRLNFDWLDVKMSKDALRKNLKHSFFTAK